MKKRKKLPSLKTLKRKAWDLMSKQVRSSAADHTGRSICVTCGNSDEWRMLDAGHYIHISKQHPLSYDKRNVHPQCRACNSYKHKGVEYADFMYRKYGSEVVNELIEKKKLPYLNRQDLEVLIIKLKSPYSEVPF